MHIARIEKKMSLLESSDLIGEWTLKSGENFQEFLYDLGMMKAKNIACKLCVLTKFLSLNRILHAQV